MSKALQPVRGTHDLLPDDFRRYQHVVTTAQRAAGYYGFEAMMTPVFESSDVFHRTLGETSDVVHKETYSFADRGGESLTLRPEFTAGIARAFISGGLQQHAPCKFFYAGPAFRYERPQKGRQRQFHQIGVELLGAAEVQADIEVIALGAQIFESLGLSAQVTLELNTLGDEQSRADYRSALVDYFSRYESELSDDSKMRLHSNPLRILDSKSEQDKKLVTDAPKGHAYLTAASQIFFDELQKGLSAIGISFHLNDRLVRGLDYYNHTVFEFTTTALGAQNAVLAGGRYDKLIAQMGGPDTAGVGFAAGVERLMALIDETEAAPKPARPQPIVLVPLGDAAQAEALKLACRLRRNGFTIEQGYRGNLSKRMQKADKLGAVAALILGENELQQGVVSLRDLRSGEQRNVPIAELEHTLNSYKDAL